MPTRLTLTASTAAAVLLAAAGTPADAQKLTGEVDLASWNYEHLYDDGFSAEHLMDADVVGPDGEEIGEVEDLVVTPGKGITHLIVETDAFLDLGDKHIRYPLERANISSPERVTIDVSEDEIDDYTLFPKVDDQELAGRMWRLSEVIDDYAYLEDRTAYGYVEDVIIHSDGEVEAVVVDPDVALRDRIGQGPYAFPFQGFNSEYGFEPGADTYNLPYSFSEVGVIPPFQYNRLGGTPTVAGPSKDEAG